MRSTILTFVCIISFLGTSKIFAQDKWIRFEPLDIPLSVVMPGVPSYEYKEIITAIGPLINDVYSLKMADDHPNFAYVINKVEYPKDFLDDEEGFLEEFLDGAVTSTAEATKCNVVYSTNHQLNGIQSKLYRLMDSDKKMVIKGKLFVYDDQLISIQAFSHIDRSMNKLVDQYLESINLKPITN